MTVFISHSFQDRPAFENLSAELDRREVPFWDPDRMRPSSSLRDQLRASLASCRVCVFIATAYSVKSEWCLTELGAFWGQGRPIVVFMADSSLVREQLPEIIRDNLWEARIQRVVDEVTELLAEPEPVAAPGAGVLSSPQLEEVIVGIVSLLRAGDHADRSDAAVPVAPADDLDLRQATRAVLHGRDATRQPQSGDGQRRILWVDERPRANAYERRAFTSAGFAVTVSGSVRDALGQLGRSRFAAVVSCLGERESYYFDLLDGIRSSEPKPPLFIYANLDPQGLSGGLAGDVAGVTNNPRELMTMVATTLSP
jgi:hypothetical protein